MTKLYTALIGALFMVLSGMAQAGDFKLSSTDISEGSKLKIDQVFKGFGCEGKNVSPALSWSGAPKGTKSFVILVHDPDAPTGSGWWHWVVANIPANVTSLPAGVKSGKALPKGALQFRNDFGVADFGGACPPKDEVHRYNFTIFAMKTEKLSVPAQSSPALVSFVTRANALASATITAVYNR